MHGSAVGVQDQRVFLDERSLRRLLGPGEDPVGVVEAALVPDGERQLVQDRRRPRPVGPDHALVDLQQAAERRLPGRIVAGAVLELAEAPQHLGRADVLDADQLARGAHDRLGAADRRRQAPVARATGRGLAPQDRHGGLQHAHVGRERFEGDAASIDHRGGHDHRPTPLDPGALPERGGGAVAQRGGLHGPAGAQARLVAALEGAIGEEALRRELARHAEAEERAAGHGPAVAVEIESLQTARGVVLHQPHPARLAGSVDADGGLAPDGRQVGRGCRGRREPEQRREREQPRRPGETHQNFSHFTARRSRPLAISTSRTRLIVASPPATYATSPPTSVTRRSTADAIAPELALLVGRHDRMIREPRAPAGQRAELVVVDEPAGITRPVDERAGDLDAALVEVSEIARMGTMPISSATNSGRRGSVAAAHEAAQGALELDLTARGERPEPARARPVGRDVRAQGDGGRRARRGGDRVGAHGLGPERHRDPLAGLEGERRAARSSRARLRGPRRPARAPRSRERGTAPASRAWQKRGPTPPSWRSRSAAAAGRRPRSARPDRARPWDRRWGWRSCSCSRRPRSARSARRTARACR